MMIENVTKLKSLGVKIYESQDNNALNWNNLAGNLKKLKTLKIIFFFFYFYLFFFYFFFKVTNKSKKSLKTPSCYP